MACEAVTGGGVEGGPWGILGAQVGCAGVSLIAGIGGTHIVNKIIGDPGGSAVAPAEGFAAAGPVGAVGNVVLHGLGIDPSDLLP